ncbi:hypothetical protein N7537_005158 [Penicillium hordei]|uniref:Uncharacterized protein n=1 Tax=Penicillium hordei TaxID=40994 RepID=A0AAD6ED32_9EURO|nr:uncharacterized protein N7537_005158 [Penicillium hordei]KAJ5608539.1 hypothetical protein N7537_005158 [Penicillium hordei]
MTICKRPPHPFDANAAPTPLNPSIVLSEESEIQSPRFPVFLSGNFALLRNSSGKHMKLVPAETPISLYSPENIVPAAFLPNAGLLRDPGCSSPFG